MPSSTSRRARPPLETVGDLVPVLGAAGWSVRREPGAPGGVVAYDDAGSVCEAARLDVPEGPGLRAALVEHLHALSEPHEHLVAVRGVVEAGESSLVVLTDHVEGLRLDDLVAAREPLRAAEAVTVLVPVAQGLAALHRDGRAHGSLDAACVVVASSGRAVLRPPLTPSSGAPADDVRDLARLVLDLVPPPASSHPSYQVTADPEEARDLAALHAELAVALRDEPSARPAAGTFAARCYDAVEPRPVVMPDAARLVAGAFGVRRTGRPGVRGSTTSGDTARGGTRTGSRSARTRRRRAVRAIATSGGILVGCAVLVALLVLLGPSRTTTPDADEPAPRAATAAVEPDADVDADAVLDPGDPAGAARALTALRLALLTEGTGDLSSVVVGGSSAEVRDTAVLEALDGVDVLDARAEVVDARLGEDWSPAPTGAGAAPTDAVVEVDYAVSAHRQRTDDSELHVPATPRTTVVLVLRWTDDGWRVAEVR
ncbi:protein kinase [Cellulosimicrobium cellulans]|uniref:Protein kinase domain-containing protein n=1 Tax=Cellulosimicrobium cellulans TaxID=1710 RepID=A0A4Y4E360_CELCE|nr:protein kinase [Cellulosimicrobium cellulans]GED11443.1 hypothetical protein CCE02nite_34420 [Cellulosimicrobium cellulans]